MTTGIQFIEHDGQRQFAVIPIEIFNLMAAYAENAEDVALFDAVQAVDDGFRIPAAVARAILDAVHPVKAWRKQRGLTQESLSAKAGISKAYLCQIEAGKRQGSLKTLRSIARVLDVPLDGLQV
jgi:DNA-binding XRE family transcriptional regulator